MLSRIKTSIFESVFSAKSTFESGSSNTNKSFSTLTFGRFFMVNIFLNLQFAQTVIKSIVLNV
jgi:hypothetical protein